MSQSALPDEAWLEPYFRYFGAMGQHDVLDSRRRARILLLVCHGAVVVALANTALRLATGKVPPLPYWVTLFVATLAMVAGPLILKRTGSIAKAALLPIAASSTAIPLLAIAAGGLDAPVLALLPSIPLISAFFIGARGAKLLAGVLVVEIGLLAAAFDAGVFPPGVQAPPLVKAALYSTFLGLGALIASAYEHERRTVEHRLRDVARQLYETSVRDHLTNVSNRRYFSQRLEKELSFAARHGTAVSVLILDADRFKLINDMRGHAAGDVVLVALASLLSNNLRAEDLVARYGGEEFVVLLRSTPIEGARVAAERLRRAVESHPFEHAGSRFTVTISIGCASTRGARTSEELLQAADRCLYEAKKGGRNCVVSHDSFEAPPAQNLRA